MEECGKTRDRKILSSNGFWESIYRVRISSDSSKSQITEKVYQRKLTMSSSILPIIDFKQVFPRTQLTNTVPELYIKALHQWADKYNKCVQS